MIRILKILVMSCAMALGLAAIPATAQTSGSGGPWEGYWSDTNNRSTILFQDGNRIWGENTSSTRLEGRVSPDGSIARYYFVDERGRRWGRVQLTLDAEGRLAEGTYAWPPDFPAEIATGQNRARLVRRDEPGFAPVLTAGPGPFFPPGIDTSTGADADWLRFAGSTDPGPDTPPDQPPQTGITDLGTWQVMMGDPSQRLGTAEVSQDRETLEMRIAGEVSFPGYLDGAMQEMVLNRGNMEATAVLTLTDAASGDAVTLSVPYEDREGDMVQIVLPAGEVVARETMVSIVAFPFEDRPADMTVYGTDWVVRIDPSLAVGVWDTPERDGVILGYLPAGTTGLTVGPCRPALNAETQRLRGALLTAWILNSSCHVAYGETTGWVLGRYINR